MNILFQFVNQQEQHQEPKKAAAKFNHNQFHDSYNVTYVFHEKGLFYYTQI